MRFKDLLPPANPTTDDDATDERERGTTLVLAAAVMLVLIGMAGFAVDLGWIYSQRTESTKAAESAALAGVVHMPNPSSTPWGPGAEAYDTALDVAKRKGHENTVNAVVDPQQIAGYPNRLRVDVSRDIPTFFMKVFGVNSITVNTTATAEQTPPLKIGSDEPFLGNVPGVQDVDFWVAVNGTRRRKGSGDPFSTHCVEKLVHNCSSTTNPEYRRPAYYYAVEVPPSEVGKQLAVQIYDGQQHNSESDTEEYNGVDGEFELRFRLFAPDATPAEPSDNTNVVCSRTFYYSTGSSDRNNWDTLNGCPVTAEIGVYVLEVDIIEVGPPGNDNKVVTAFSIRSLINGSMSNETAVYGLGSMSLWMTKPGASPTFKIVKLEEYYANTELILNLFDAGDLTGTGQLRIIGELAAVDCEVRIRNADLSIAQNWGPDDGEAGCFLDISNKEYDNQWVDLRFPVANDYTCAIDCWVLVDFVFSNDPYERTTWSATINGLPVHLIS